MTVGTSISNKVVTRGFGSKRLAANQAGPVSQGFGGPPSFVVAAIERPLRLRLGQSGTKRRLEQLDEVIVWAKLVELNGKEPSKPIKGWVRAKVDPSRGYASVMAEHIASRARAAWEVIRVSVSRLK